MFRLDSLKVLVTGAVSASGISFASAKALKDMGVEVFITSTSDRIYLRAEESSISSPASATEGIYKNKQNSSLSK